MAILILLSLLFLVTDGRGFISCQGHKKHLPEYTFDSKPVDLRYEASEYLHEYLSHFPKPPLQNLTNLLTMI